MYHAPLLSRYLFFLYSLCDIQEKGKVSERSGETVVLEKGRRLHLKVTWGPLKALNTDCGLREVSRAGSPKSTYDRASSHPGPLDFTQLGRYIGVFSFSCIYQSGAKRPVMLTWYPLIFLISRFAEVFASLQPSLDREV